MKKGPLILLALGIIALVALNLAPVKPEQALTPKTEAPPLSNTPGDTDKVHSPDQRVRQALEQLRDGSTPPMQAIMAIRSVAEEHPDNVLAQMTLGSLSLQTAQYEKARSRMKKVLELTPQSSQAWAVKGRAEANLGDTTQAIASLQKALQYSSEQNKAPLQKRLSQLQPSKN
ncbi:MAG: tetratricopeptide repeat protein [Schleiferiaceae bacterium]|nr:tetratricopeptide repeat protein [Schleiferiaceae bacterium]MDR9441629.1 tetratricopeptide repeat protein [Schleiferiaceae bacterium]